MTRIHVSPLDCEGTGSPSVGAGCLAVTGGPADYGNVATAVCVTLPTPHNAATALDSAVVEA